MTKAIKYLQVGRLVFFKEKGPYTYGAGVFPHACRHLCRAQLCLHQLRQSLRHAAARWWHQALLTGSHKGTREQELLAPRSRIAMYSRLQESLVMLLSRQGFAGSNSGTLGGYCPGQPADPARGHCFPVYEQPVDGSAGSQISSSSERSFRESRKETYFHSREEKRKMRSVALNKEENLMGKRKVGSRGSQVQVLACGLHELSVQLG